MAFAPVDFLVKNNLVWAIIIFLTSIALAEILNIVLKSIVALFTSRTKTELDDDLVKAIKKPVFFGIILMGIYYSLLSIDQLLPFGAIISKIATIVGILIAYFLVERIVRSLVKWYSFEVYPRITGGAEHKNLTIFRKIFDVILFIIFLLIILHYLGVEITPFIASLGIGGLAVALALQQTLGDFIAGLSIINDKSLKIGDYVELDSTIDGSTIGGYIEDISWRTSRIRTLGNNYVIIPNTKFAQSISTDYNFGSSETFVGINLPVSYKSDLDKVEKLVNRVAAEIQNTEEGAVKGYEPRLRFTGFGDNNIEGAISLKVSQFSNQYKVKHEFIKRIKKEFEKNKIEISRPTGFVYLKK